MTETDIIGAGDRWLSPEAYACVRALVPILCVDVLLSPRGKPGTVGLIRRDEADRVHGWCLVGGRVLRNERLTAAVERHVAATLGDGVRVDLSTLAMRTVAEYFTEGRHGNLHDPLKHAVALTYTVSCDGVPRPAGEAADFRWFRIRDLDSVSFGFGQGAVIAHVLACAAPDALPAAMRAALERPLRPPGQ